MRADISGKGPLSIPNLILVSKFVSFESVSFIGVTVLSGCIEVVPGHILVRVEDDLFSVTVFEQINPKVGIEAERCVEDSVGLW